MQPNRQARLRNWAGSSRRETDRVLAAHRAAGRPFTAAGARSFVREAGSGPAVVFVHGVWGASFAYRKLVVNVADRGMRAIAWDLPGFGFAGRPPGRDYSPGNPGALYPPQMPSSHDEFGAVEPS